MEILNKNIETDYLIIGGGLAGLNAAYHASKFGNVILITNKSFEQSNSWLAQGGIAAAISNRDSIFYHKEDTLIAGRELSSSDVVSKLVSEGRERILDLIDLGMDFEKDGQTISLGIEGGHSFRRIVHADGNATGKAVIKFLMKKVSLFNNVKILFDTECFELKVSENIVYGGYAFNKSVKELYNITSKSTILATGGYGNLFSRTTNSETIIGQGISLAHNAGAIIKDLEFVQFHPTGFYSEKGQCFLISEAVRGEGAYLLNQNYERFMLRLHPSAELAPRDIVAKAIHDEIKEQTIPYVYLDMRHLDKQMIRNRFKNIFVQALKNGIDFTKDLIPVAPAAHYSIGGIDTDDKGRTNLKNLYACGEVTSTGVHGANRLASNSLLECLVFSKSAVETAKEESKEKSYKLPEKSFTFNSNREIIFTSIQKSIQKLFKSNVGIVRNSKLLKSAIKQIDELKKYYTKEANEINQIKINNLIELSELIIRSALARKESRGAHQRSDYPEMSDEFRGNFYIHNSQIKFIESKWKYRKSI